MLYSLVCSTIPPQPPPLSQTPAATVITTILPLSAQARSHVTEDWHKAHCSNQACDPQEAPAAGSLQYGETKSRACFRSRTQQIKQLLGSCMLLQTKARPATASHRSCKRKCKDPSSPTGLDTYIPMFTHVNLQGWHIIWSLLRTPRSFFIRLPGFDGLSTAIPTGAKGSETGPGLWEVRVKPHNSQDCEGCHEISTSLLSNKASPFNCL